MKTTRSFWHCRSALGNKWSLSPKVMNFIYRIFVRSYISYASVVWWAKVHQKNIATSLLSLQILACIGITGAIRTALTAALEVCLGLHPLPYFIEAKPLCAAVCLQRTEMWRTSDLNYGHSTFLEKSQFTDPKVLISHLITLQKLTFLT